MNKHEDAVDRPQVANLLRAYDFEVPGKYTDLRESHAQQALNPHSIGRHHYIAKGRGVLALIRRLSLEHPERNYRELRTRLISARAAEGYSISVEISMERDLCRQLEDLTVETA
ncbi:hypothetical protein QNA24_29755 [Rhodococcus qingshengii]|uniref:hypothetical protein n=1 Tax=Rhodococcus TaxID=1827 RepID=UPI001E4E5464|nr:MULTISPECIES: hypothetical protein [Rhodococcus]MCD2099558.1 hypothetical protein [Rhodococcus rhodochrous]MCD2123926.1 hypothetical protein [Rhodococcus rhodochrous]MCQ4136645.1 hypothetical protein [Rhodococcus rhodochrous]MDJ0490569.1 hypothetical protein [Rhodococcus qingshengii]